MIEPKSPTIQKPFLGCPHTKYFNSSVVLRHVDSFTMRQVKWIGELRSQSDWGDSRPNRNLMLAQKSKKHFCALIKTNDAADICWRKWVGNEIAVFFLGNFIFYRFPLHAAIVESFTAKKAELKRLTRLWLYRRKMFLIAWKPQQHRTGIDWPIGAAWQCLRRKLSVNSLKCILLPSLWSCLDTPLVVFLFDAYLLCVLRKKMMSNDGFKRNCVCFHHHLHFFFRLLSSWASADISVCLHTAHSGSGGAWRNMNGKSERRIWKETSTLQSEMAGKFSHVRGDDYRMR